MLRKCLKPSLFSSSSSSSSLLSSTRDVEAAAAATFILSTCSTIAAAAAATTAPLLCVCLLRFLYHSCQLSREREREGLLTKAARLITAEGCCEPKNRKLSKNVCSLVHHVTRRSLWVFYSIRSFFLAFSPFLSQERKSSLDECRSSSNGAASS